MAYKDYYQILGVDRNAGEQEIKRAYRKLARKYHPDINPGDKAAETRFKEINEAYEVLSDKDKRSKYDRFGRDWQRYEQATGAGGAGGAGGFDWNAYGGNANFDFQDIFETFFGGGGGGGGARRRGAGPGAGPGGFGMHMDGQDIEHSVDITLEEAFSGTQRRVQFTNPDGTPRFITVKIPVGADTGTKVRVPGEGGAGAGGGRRGDLLLLVRLQPHQRFEREGENLKVQAHVDLYTLMLGGEMQVSTIDGKRLTLNIPAGTPNGRVFRLGGQGMPRLRQTEQRGDLYVTVEAQLPTNLSSRERELFEELRTMRS